MGHVARWLTFIEQFNHEVVHRAGARHGNADGLSRRPDAHHEPSTAAHYVTVTENVEDAHASEPNEKPGGFGLGGGASGYGRVDASGTAVAGH